MPDANNRFRTLQQSNDVRVLTSVFDFNPGLVVTEQVFGDIDFAFDHSTPLSDCGVVGLFRNSANYTFYDFVGRLVRCENGVETLLATVAVPATAGRATLSLRRRGHAHIHLRRHRALDSHRAGARVGGPGGILPHADHGPELRAGRLRQCAHRSDQSRRAGGRSLSLRPVLSPSRTREGSRR